LSLLLVVIVTCLGCCFCPFFMSLVLFLVPLLVALDGRLMTEIVFPLPRTKTALIASSPKACWVVISNNSLVVFNRLWLSSCIKVLQVVLNQNDEMTSALPHHRELMKLLGEVSNVVLEGFVRLLSATLQVRRVAGEDLP
jgi:hypothetical protein